MTGYLLRPPEDVNLIGVETGRDHLSHSAIGTFLGCQQKYNWSYEHRLTPAVTATPFALGRAFAEALEHGDPEHGERLLREQAAAEAERAAGNPWLTSPDEETVDIQATIVREASAAYLRRYGQHEQTREVELRARIRNPAVGGRYSLTHDILGRVDALSHDGLTLFEDKLVGQIPRGSLAARLRLDRQVTIGCYLVWRCLGIEVAEVKYRMTLKPGIRRRQAESHALYLQRIRAEYESRPDHYLIEEPVTRSPDDYLRLEQELWRWAETIRDARRDGIWPRNTAQCHEYAGCAYLALCAREPGADHQFVMREERPKEAVPA